MLTRDARMPYSPTILPYIVSGRSRPDKVVLRDAAYLRQNSGRLQRDAEVRRRRSGGEIRRAPRTGTLWTIRQAVAGDGRHAGRCRRCRAWPMCSCTCCAPWTTHRRCATQSARAQSRGRARRRAVRHACRGEHGQGGRRRIGDRCAAGRCASISTPRAGAHDRTRFAGTWRPHRLMGRTPAAVERLAMAAPSRLTMARRWTPTCCMVGTGVRPAIGYLAGSGVATGRGILVDRPMRTSVADVWAAGDVAEARCFWGGTAVNGILPGAVEQGRIAGADMAGDAACKRFPARCRSTLIVTSSITRCRLASGGQLAGRRGFRNRRTGGCRTRASTGASCCRTAGWSAFPASMTSSIRASCGSSSCGRPILAPVQGGFPRASAGDRPAADVAAVAIGGMHKLRLPTSPATAGEVAERSRRQVTGPAAG